MLRQYFVKSPILMFPVIAMVVFMTLFVAIVLRIWWQKRNPQARQLNDELARLPLGDEDNVQEVVS